MQLFESMAGLKKLQFLFIVQTLLLANTVLASGDRLYFLPAPEHDTCKSAFDYVQNINNSLTIQFNDYSTGDFSIWDWDFGDGSHSGQQNPLHQFPDTGVYVVCLTISSPIRECFDTHCDTVVVPVPDDCETFFTYEQVPEDPFQVYFISDPGSDVEIMQWSFGDGTFSDLENPFHEYADTGVYIVSLTATNHHNPFFCHSVVYDTVVVKIDQCISNFTFTPTQGFPFEVHFSSTAQGSFNSIYWDFGDNRTSNEMNPVHVYADTGVFNVCLTIGNYNFPDFCEDQICKEVKIELVNCESLFSYVLDSIYPLKVAFYNQSVGVANQQVWNFGDGTASEELNPLHYYPEPGTYNVCLSVYNSLFPEYCEDSICQLIGIEITECTASFNWVTDSLRPLEVQFKSQINGNPDKVVWDFGDGGIETGENPFHIFPDTGTYVVTLSVTNSAFLEYCNAVESRSLHLRINHKPKPDFTYMLDSVSATPNVFYFNDNSDGYDIREWKWTFGDGQVSEIQNPDHQYLQSLTYNVCLTVTDHLPPKYTIPAKICKPLHTYAYYDLGGSVFDSDFPINNPANKGDTARVYIYRVYSGGEIIPIDTGVFYQLGYYWFSQMLANEYVIKAELTENSNQYGKFFPTYSTKSLFWQGADPISLYTNMFDIDVQLVPKPHMGSGSGKISGMVVKVPEPTAQTGEPMPKVNVYLADNKYRILDFTIADSAGKFNFSDLPFGMYILIPDVTGLFYREDTAFLSPVEPTNEGILLRVWDKQATLGLPEYIAENQIIIIPNPVLDVLTVFSLKPIKGTAVIEIFSASGQMVRQESVGVNNDGKGLSVHVGTLPQSLYLMRIITKDGIFSQTFIKR